MGDGAISASTSFDGGGDRVEEHNIEQHDDVGSCAGSSDGSARDSGWHERFVPPWWRAAGVAADEMLASIGRPLVPIRSRIDRVRGLRDEAAIAATTAVCLWYFYTLTVLVWQRHEWFGTFDYDLGMYDHGIWQTSQFRNFMTTRGMDLFGHHANVGYLLLVPFYWIGTGGPHFLNIVNTLGVVLVAVPLFLLARTHMKSSWMGFWLVVAYLFHFSTAWKIQETFHAESLAAPFVVGAFYFATLRRWRPYAVCIALALIWKEDVALTTAAMGIAVGFVGRSWRAAVATIVASLAWFVVATQLIMPAFAPDGAVFDSLFGPLGESSTEVVVTSVKHPTRLFDTVWCHGVWDGELRTAEPPIEGVSCPTAEAVAAENPPPRGLATLLGPLGYLGLLSPLVLLSGVPQHVVNSSTIVDFTWDLRWHYAFLPFIGVMMASAWTVVKRKRAVVAWAMIVLMLGSVAVTADRGIGPWTDNAKRGWWSSENPELHQAYLEAMEDIDGDDVVSGNYFFVPHLSHREYIYTFPNPWVLSNYGAGGTEVEAPDPATVDVLVIDAHRLGERDTAVFDEIILSGEFEIEFRSTVDRADLKFDVMRLRRR